MSLRLEFNIGRRAVIQYHMTYAKELKKKVDEEFRHRETTLQQHCERNHWIAKVATWQMVIFLKKKCAGGEGGGGWSTSLLYIKAMLSLAKFVAHQP